jgi:hypothetical protein
MIKKTIIINVLDLKRENNNHDRQKKEWMLEEENFGS